MTAKTVLNIAVEIHDESAVGVVDKYLSGTDNPKAGLRGLSNMFDQAAGGGIVGRVTVQSDQADGTQASSTLTCTQANATDADTCTVAGVVFTRQSSPSSEPSDGEFAGSTDDNTCASELQAAIDAHPKLKGVIAATVATNVVTIKSAIKTPVGLGISLASSDGTFIAVGAAKLASGATGTVQGEARAYAFGVI